MRTICGSLVRTLPHQSLRSWGLLVRTLLIDLADTTIEAAAVGGLSPSSGLNQNGYRHQGLPSASGPLSPARAGSFIGPEPKSLAKLRRIRFLRQIKRVGLGGI
jgi:hypothetical protein